MKKILASLFLFLFVFQIAAFADASQPVPESKLKKAGRETVGVMQRAVWKVWDFTYLALKKVDVA